MAYSNTSSAYDLSAFEAAPKPKKKQQPKLRVVKSRKKATLAALFSPRVFSSFAIVITLVCLIIYNQARLTEITGEINDINKDLQSLRSEYVQMENQLNATVSLRNIAEQAQHELGMQKRDKYQTEYVYLFEEDKIELTADSPKEGLLEQAKLTINATVDALKEYMSNE